MSLQVQCGGIGKENGWTTRSSTQCGKSSNLSMDITEVIQINANNLPNANFGFDNGFTPFNLFVILHFENNHNLKLT